MAKRRKVAQWDALSPAYRKRLERNGVSREQYLRGNRLGSARGHSQTPERPERATRNPQRYQQYLGARFDRFAKELATANPHADPAMRWDRIGPQQATAWAAWHEKVRREKESFGAVDKSTFGLIHGLHADYADDFAEDEGVIYEDVADLDDMYWY